MTIIDLTNVVLIDKGSSGDCMSVSKVLKRILTIMRDCSENAQHDPRTALSWNLKGIALSNEDKYNEAIEAFDNAIELAPSWEKPKN